MTLRSATLSLLSGLAFLFVSHGTAYATDPVTEQQNTTTTTPSAPTLRLPLLSSAALTSNDPQATELGRTSEPATAQTAPVAQPDILAQNAIAYGSYQSDVSTFKQNLESAADIDEAMNTLGTHNARNLATGWLSYSALLASQSPEFRKGVIDTDNYFGRERLLTGMRNSPAYTLSLDGADDAMNRALGAGKADARRLDSVGEKIKEQAYSLQALGWAKAKLPGKPSDHAQKLRLAAANGRPQSGAVRSLFLGPDFNSTVTRANALGGTTSLWDRVTMVGSDIKLPGSSFVSTRNRVLVKREREVTAGNIATLAALNILGETKEQTPYVTSALEDKQAQGCFEQAQLNLLQCVSASRNVFERPFCIGVHALKEVGSCVGGVSR